MRFLISEHPMYDLVIGSQSIHENGILDVPNLGDLIVWNRVEAGMFFTVIKHKDTN